MKAQISSLLVLCILFAFSVAAYADGGSAYQNTTTPTKYYLIDGNDLYPVPSGVTVSWTLYVEVYIAQQGHAEAYAEVSNSNGYIRYKNLNETGPIYKTDSLNGSYYNYGDDFCIDVCLEAKVRLESGMGGANSYVTASW